MSVDQNLGLLHAVDERLAAYCWLTNTGVKLLVVVDMAGRPAGEFPGSGSDKKKGAPVVSLREAELKPVCWKPSLDERTMILIRVYLGIPCVADCLYPTITKSVLRAR